MTVRELVPKLWDLERQTERPPIDLTIHIGMAGPTLRWQLERRGHRDGYALKDVDGEFLRDQNRKLKEGKDWIWDGVPAELLSDVDIDGVYERWKKHGPVRFSPFALEPSLYIPPPPPFSPSLWPRFC